MKNDKKMKPSKELQKAIDMFPKIVKHKEKVVLEKKKIRKNFESVRSLIFKKES